MTFFIEFSFIVVVFLPYEIVKNYKYRQNGSKFKGNKKIKE